LVDPFYESTCWRTCEHNPLLIGQPGIGETVALVGLVGLAFGAAGSAAAGVPEGLRGPGSATGADAAGWIALGGLVGSLLMVSGAGAVSGDDDLPVALFIVVQSASIAWLALLCWQSWRRWRLESRLAHLVDLMGSTSDPEALVNSLQSAVRDPDLRLAYWAPARQIYVDTSGRPASGTAPGPHQQVTAITRHGQTIAAIVHSRRVDGQRLERALRPALRLALENAQLRAASLAELSELTSSRTRVVERAQLERRRLERNLHDGAQQRVVSLALLVRLLPGQTTAVDREAGERAQVLTRTLVEELRRVARGIYPAVLADAGLLGGVLDLAERSDDLPVIVGDFPETRYAGTIETTAYLFVRDGIADARSRGATCVSVAGNDRDDTLRVSVEDDAAVTPYVVATELADQVGALGGTLVMNGAPGRRRVEVLLPCVS
jgi:signal transduction histidine kinase